MKKSNESCFFTTCENRIFYDKDEGYPSRALQSDSCYLFKENTVLYMQEIICLWVFFASVLILKKILEYFYPGAAGAVVVPSL